jgi:hypothetical protein
MEIDLAININAEGSLLLEYSHHAYNKRVPKIKKPLPKL